MSFARMRALVVVGVLVLAAVVLVVVALFKDKQTIPIEAQGCAKNAVIANIKLPEPSAVKINVYNATAKPGLATDEKNEFKARRFTVDKVGNDPLAKRVDGVAVLRFGPKAAGAAWLLRAYFLDQATREFDITRKDDHVDVVLGNGFKQLATTTEVNQALAQLGNPTLPEGTCAGN
jgi:hypothetical protein